MKPSPFLLVLLIVALASCETSTPAPDYSASGKTQVWSQLTEFIQADMARNGITGLSIAVTTSEGLLWSAGFGKADPSTDRPFTPQTISNEGSVSKLLTATAVMKLVEDGEVDLDAPLTRYLPDFRPKSRFPNARPITVRDLMTHHSGLPSDYLQGFIPGTVQPAGYPSFQTNVDLASRLSVTGPPGTAFSYSNLAVSLLGVVVERVSGLSFEAFCQTRVLEPLGMKNSSFLLPKGFETHPQYARGPFKGQSTAIPFIRDIPAGALNSTADDMARLAVAYLAAYRGKPGVLSQEAVKPMFAVQNAGVEPDVGFQIGLNFWRIPVDQLPGEFIVGHGGDLDPFHALFLLLPDRDLAVTIQVNSIGGMGSFSLADIASQALRAGAWAAGQTPIAPAPAKAAPVVLSADDITRLSGTYASPMGVLRVRPQGQGLQVFQMGLWMDGVPRADGSIGLEARILGLKLPIDVLETLSLKETRVNGDKALAIVIGGMPYGAAVPVAAVPVPAAWKARIGDYRVSGPTPGDIADEGRVFVDSDTGLFMLSVRAMGQTVALPIEPLSDTEAVTRGYGRNLGEILTGGDGTLGFGGLVFTRK